MYTKTGKVLITAAAVFVARLTERASVAQGLFFGGSGCRAGAHTHPAWPKIPTAPSAFPLLGVPGNIPTTPLKGIKAGGDGLLRLEEISSCRDTLGQICATASTAGLTSAVLLQLQWYLFSVPPTGRVCHKAFF